jgi:hypothetical protein
MRPLGLPPGIPLLLCLFLYLAPASFSLESDVGFARAIYGPWNYTQDAMVGLDADYDNTWWTQGPERVLDKFRRNSMEAAASNITYVAGLYYLGDHARFDYVRAVNDAGLEQTETPSPVDRTYWMRMMEEPALAVANLSLHYPIWGLVWDFELYLADDGWGTEDYSFDHAALQEFAVEKGHIIPNLTPRQRHPWLRDNGLLGEYLAWQEEEVYEMARETEAKVHAINPELSLGILGFSDCWRYWITLQAFCAPGAPVTLWTEDTYGGYDEDRIDYLRESLDGYGLEGKVLPGLYTVALSPWKMVEDMERAIRHNGAFWIYQHDGDQYRLADEWTYSRAYDAFNRYIFFNASRARALPTIELYPGVEARPYDGPDGVTLLLLPRPGISAEGAPELLTESSQLHYIGKNVTLKVVKSRNLSLGEMPCMIYGLTREDIHRTHAWSLVREIDTLLGLYNRLELGRLPAIEGALAEAKEDFLESRYDLVIEGLNSTVATGYGAVLDAVWPLIEEAKRSPRESPIPIAALSKISGAERMYSQGDYADGNAYLLSGLGAWAAAVPEGGCLALAAVAFPWWMARNRGRLRRSSWT